MPPHTICAKGLIQVPEGRQLFPRMSHRNRRWEPITGSGKISRHRWNEVFNLFPILKERKKKSQIDERRESSRCWRHYQALMSCETSLLDEPSRTLSGFDRNLFGALRQLEAVHYHPWFLKEWPNPSVERQGLASGEQSDNPRRKSGPYEQ
jgi:ABC-type branched-subunit amino acid transport system ATPase component